MAESETFFPKPPPRRPGPKLPGVEVPDFARFRVPRAGVALMDADDVSGRARAKAHRIMENVLERQVIQAKFPDVNLCRNGLRDYHDERFATAQLRNPRLGLEEFLCSLGDEVVRDEADADPRLGHRSLIVFEDREVSGMFILYNVRLSGTDPLEASAMAMPGCRPAGGLRLTQTWAAIMRWLLEENAPLADGREFDLTEWRLPGRNGHRWDQGAEGVEILGELSDHEMIVEDRPCAIRKRRARQPQRL